MNSGIGISRIQPIGPRPANSFKANGQDWKRTHVHVLKAVRVRQFALKEHRASFVKSRSVVRLQKIFKTHVGCPVATRIGLECRSIKRFIARCPFKMSKGDHFVLGEEDGVLWKRKRGIVARIGPKPRRALVHVGPSPSLVHEPPPHWV
jgi:hypothetical protein